MIEMVVFSILLLVIMFMMLILGMYSLRYKF